MMVTRRLIYPALLLLAVFTAQAQPYKWMNGQGQTWYGDIAPEEVPFERLAVPPPPVPDPYYEQRVQRMKRYVEERAAKRRELQARHYDSITIVQPRNDGLVREDGTGISVAVAVNPELRAAEGHLIRFLFDGNPLGEGSAETTTNVVGVERGRHTVAAQILDSAGAILLRSPPVTFHYQRESHLHTAPFFVPFRGPAGAAPNMIPPDRLIPPERRAPRAPNVPPANWILGPLPVPPPPSGGSLGQ